MNFDDIIRSNTITVRFVNMSRTCTHQLVRHRNAITQQSQRYVSAENATFTIPRGNGLSYKSIKLESEEYSYSLEDVLCNAFNISRLIYSELLKNGVKKEDARSILSENTNCEEIYITFTYYNLKKFLELRTDPHAQEEIRSYATALLYALRAGCIPDQDPKPKFLYNYLESVANTLDNSKK
jgi:thymidylate synthase (FAD)